MNIFHRWEADYLAGKFKNSSHLETFFRKFPSRRPRPQNKEERRLGVCLGGSAMMADRAKHPLNTNIRWHLGGLHFEGCDFAELSVEDYARSTNDEAVSLYVEHEKTTDRVHRAVELQRTPPPSLRIVRAGWLLFYSVTGLQRKWLKMIRPHVEEERNSDTPPSLPLPPSTKTPSCAPCRPDARRRARTDTPSRTSSITTTQGRRLLS